jgi:hypothetical protein
LQHGRINRSCVVKIETHSVPAQGLQVHPLVVGTVLEPDTDVVVALPVAQL